MYVHMQTLNYYLSIPYYQKTKKKKRSKIYQQLINIKYITRQQKKNE